MNEPSETIPIEETVKWIIHGFRFKRIRYMVEHPDSITDENLFPDDLSRHAEAVAIVRAVRDDAALTAGEDGLEMAVFCDGHTRLQPCEPECLCVQHYDAVRKLIR